MNAEIRDAARYVLSGGALAAVEALLAPPRQPDSPIAPPRVGFGIAWSVLFAALGVARARLDAPRQRRLDRLWLLCATYPLWTFGMRSRTLTYAGNALVAIQAARAANDARGRDGTAALLVGALVPWVAYATAILLTERRR